MMKRKPKKKTRPRKPRRPPIPMLRIFPDKHISIMMEEYTAADMATALLDDTDDFDTVLDSEFDK
jgi:hypothetical protein